MPGRRAVALGAAAGMLLLLLLALLWPGPTLRNGTGRLRRSGRDELLTFLSTWTGAAPMASAGAAPGAAAAAPDSPPAAAGTANVSPDTPTGLRLHLRLRGISLAGLRSAGWKSSEPAAAARQQRQQQLWQQRLDVAAVRQQLDAGVYDANGGGGSSSGGSSSGSGGNSSSSSGGSGRSPVIFLPPLTGVQMQMRLDHKPAAPHFWCRRTTGGWQLAWLNLRLLLPWAFDCFVDNFRLEFDAQGRCRGPAGVSVRPAPGFQSAMGVVPNAGKYFATFAPLAAALEELGWKRDIDMLAHLYDWRLPPTEWVRGGGAFDQLKHQIEAAVHATGRPAVAVSLSMGAPYFALFLRRHVTPAWQERYIAGHVAISGVWAGSLLAPLSVVTGSNGPPPQFQSEALLRLLRALPVLSWLAPAPAVFGDQVLMRDEAAGGAFTAAGMGAWLRARGASQAADVWEANQEFAEDGQAPQVPLYCLYSTGVETAAAATFFMPSQEGPHYQLHYSDGDGTVLLRSLQLCDTWRAARVAPGPDLAAPQAPAVHIRRYPGIRHAALLSDGEAFADVVDAVLALNQRR